MEQMKNGVTFTLPHRLEFEVAEELTEIIPCAEMVRFGKNGSDATSGAIRLARAYKKRDRIAICGYHGWQDWYIGTTTRKLGVPEIVQNLSHVFQYNNIESLNKVLKEHPGEFAAVIMEPMNVTEPTKNFLNEVKELAHKHGALFIMDEVITGFRYALGGAQEYFDVTPDLASFGKGMGNGYPIAAVVGKAEIMTVMNDIFFSTTFGGETLSLAASKAVIKKLKTEPVIENIKEKGTQVLNETTRLIKKNNLEEVLGISGHPSWSLLSFKDHPNNTMWEIKTLFLQEMYKRGILSIGSHNMSYAHSKEDLQHLFKSYDEIFGMINEGLTKNNLKQKLECDVLVPVFRVR
jgi:glutamate-1-semialdehyde 2,1-aminomutase